MASLSPKSTPPQRKPSTASSLMRISMTRTTPTRSTSRRTLGARPGETTATCTVAPTSVLVDETFQKTFLRQYGLDPAHYYTTLGLLWDALLKKTGVELELLTDYDQHLFIEKRMLGGISMVSKRHAKANNPLVDGYGTEKLSSYILYLDANNICGWAMSLYLPTGEFRWVDDRQHLAKTIAEQPADGPEGFMVDLEYPENLHKAHNAYPLAPERMVVQKKWMSEYQHNLLGAVVAPTEVEKLVPNLHNKNLYVLHYRNLQLYMSLGMRLAKVHCALRFDQSPWMQPYTRINTVLRNKAASDFEKDLYKLMNNSVFGNTMDTLQNWVDVKLVRSHVEDKLRRLIASPAFARANILDKDLAAIQVHKSRLQLNRPVHVGMSILDLSKHQMYDFYYNKLKLQYGESCQLLYTTLTAFSLRSRPRMRTRTWPRIKASTTRLTTPRPPSVQFSQQEGFGKVERRVRRAGNRRVCWPAPKDVLNS